MAQDTTNPFVLPGFGQQGEAAGNPLLAGLDMMRQAWQNMAAGKLPNAPEALPSMSLEDLERRIRELQTVQNWLQLNATMLASTIQGLEIQRSTLQTLQSFSGATFAPADTARGRTKPGRAAGKPAAEDHAAGGQAYVQAASDWWNLVQQQFEHLREATAASIDEMAEAGQAAAAAATPQSASATAPRKAAPKRSAAASKPASKASGRKPAAKKAATSRSAGTRRS